MKKRFLTVGLCIGVVAQSIPAFLHLLTGGNADKHFIVAYLIGVLGVVVGFHVRGISEECIRDAEKQEPEL